MKSTVFLFALLILPSMSFAEMTYKSTCHVFKNGKLAGKQSCIITDYQTNGSQWAIDYQIDKYGKFETYGGLDINTGNEFTNINGYEAKEQTRLRSNYKIVNVSWQKFSKSRHLSCIKQKNNKFEICS